MPLSIINYTLIAFSFMVGVLLVVVLVMLLKSRKESYVEVDIEHADEFDVKEFQDEYNNNSFYNMRYEAKMHYLSDTEVKFGNAIKRVLNNKYILFPQIPLSQIVMKISKIKYQNELYRSIDFCVFDNDYRPLVCIEINDATHNHPDRYNRDRKVKYILDQAGLPLITFHTEFGVNEEYIEKRLKEHLDLL